MPPPARYRYSPPSLDVRIGHVGVGVRNLGEHKLVLVLDQELRRPLDIDKECVDLLDVLNLNLPYQG